jgi:hypothetical protein
VEHGDRRFVTPRDVGRELQRVLGLRREVKRGEDFLKWAHQGPPINGLGMHWGDSAALS